MHRFRWSSVSGACLAAVSLAAVSLAAVSLAAVSLAAVSLAAVSLAAVSLAAVSLAAVSLAAVSLAAVSLAAVSCMPSSDLDAAARGSGDRSGSPEAPSATDGLLPGGAETPTPGGSSGTVPGATGGTSTEPGVVPAGLDVGASDATGNDGSAIGSTGADAGVGTTDAGVDPPPEPNPPPTVVEAPPLPDDLSGAPVEGEIVFSDDAEWEVDGVFEPTFEIHTPTASYWVVKPLGTIVSIEDSEPEKAQWIAFSSGFRPLRGVPSFPTPPETRVSTVRDGDSQTPTHVRLTSSSDDGLWQWVWDFYVTHVTFTVNRAPVPFGFGYQGVPGGSLGTEDRLVSSDGTTQGARSSFNGDLAGPVEWAYLADTTLGRSLFAIQHQDDTVPERYQVRDNDTSLLLFGSGQLESLPIRFSLGLIPSVDHDAVTQRVDFITRAIR